MGTVNGDFGWLTYLYGSQSLRRMPADRINSKNVHWSIAQKSNACKNWAFRVHKVFTDAGIRNVFMNVDIENNATVAQLFQEYAEHIGLIGTFGLVYGGKELKETNTNGKIMHLNDHGIEDESTIGAVLRLPGGSEKRYGPNVKLSSNEDMLYLDDQAVDMPCGHAIGPNSMTWHAQTQVGPEHKKYEICCPAIVDDTKHETCNHPWCFKKIKKVALFTKDERTDVEGKISDNYIRIALNCRECPKCKSYCVRQNKGNPRVVCTYCTCKSGTQYEFCWVCLRQWKTSGISSCGNDNCENVSIVFLRNCETKTVVGVSNCPSTRGCPHCGTLIQHTEACKHMNCPGCKNNFCFICLKCPVNGSWQCGSYNTPCQVARRQTILP